MLKYLLACYLVFFKIVLACDDHEKVDNIAVSACTALSRPGMFVSAVRRDCSGSPSTTCHDVCRLATRSMKSTVGNQGRTPKCIDALHFYNKYEPAAFNKAGMMMHHYGASRGCGWKGCGPNYCCCAF